MKATSGTTLVLFLFIVVPHLFFCHSHPGHCSHSEHTTYGVQEDHSPDSGDPVHVPVFEHGVCSVFHHILSPNDDLFQTNGNLLGFISHYEMSPLPIILTSIDHPPQV